MFGLRRGTETHQCIAMSCSARDFWQKKIAKGEGWSVWHLTTNIERTVAHNSFLAALVWRTLWLYFSDPRRAMVSVHHSAESGKRQDINWSIFKATCAILMSTADKYSNGLCAEYLCFMCMDVFITIRRPESPMVHVSSQIRALKISKNKIKNNLWLCVVWILHFNLLL